MHRFLLARTVTSMAAIVIALVESDVQRLLLAACGLFALVALLSGLKVSRGLLWATLLMAVPLLLLHGVVNPTYLTTYKILGLPIRGEGAWHAVVISGRMALLFGVLGLWLGTPRRVLLGLVAASRLPPMWGFAMLQAVSLTHVLAARISRIRMAQRSRGVLRDDMGLFSRLRAAVAVVVPLIATTLIDANERGSSLHRMGVGAYPLTQLKSLEVLAPADAIFSGCVLAAAVALLWL